MMMMMILIMIIIKNSYRASSQLIMHDETTSPYFIKRLHLLCFELFSNFSIINETKYRHHSFMNFFCR